MLSVDLGQSGSRIRINGKTTASTRGKLAGEPIADSLRAIFAMLEKIESEVVALSLTGLSGIVKDPSSIGNLCAEFFGAKHTAVIDDGLAACVGALQGSAGVALAIGGGVVAVGGNGKNFSHTDGLGSIFGDEGSGFWLGSSALTRVLATREFRDDQHDLLEFFADEVKKFDQIELKNSAEGSSLAIASAQKVLTAADNGIPSALKIRSEGAFQLAQAIVAAWELAQGLANQSPVIVIMGGLSQNFGYTNEISKFVSAKIPNAKFAKPLGDNLDGAEWIAIHMKEDTPPMLRWHHE